MNDQSDNDDEGYSTPRESPLKPRALSKSTKKFTRRVFDLRKRVNELKGCNLDESLSFYVPHWSLTTEHVVSLKNKPKDNVQIMVKMVQLVESLLKETFIGVSGCYIGKTSDLPARFKQHQVKKQKTGQALLMITLACFQFSEIPKEDKERYEVDTDTLALLYERMLTTEMFNKRVKMFGDSIEMGGGGRGGKRENVDRNCFVYCLYSVS